ncbi:MAG: dTMP kinase, partial [Clostridiales bacterium]|jgi:dTMP kinase|nr:dTMP kinase [Clostridiales bacterium]
MKLKLRKHNYSGRLIVFEGTDGAGKTTLINLTRGYLAERLGAENVVVTKTPTDMSRNTKLFQKMMYCKNHADIDYRAVQLLTMSDRIQHGFEEIEPALKAGKTVVCDRYIYTSLANMLARGYDRERWFFEAAESLVKPDAVFLAYVPPGLAIQRIKARPEECRRHLDEGQLKKTAANFLAMSKGYGFATLDTVGDAGKPFGIIRAVLGALFEKKEEAA